MEAKIAQILKVIKDYRNDDDIHLTDRDIAEWADQFGDVYEAEYYREE